MKLIIFAITLSCLLSLYNVEATSRTLEEQVAPAPACNIDANAALLAGLKALDAETTKAITEAEKLSMEKPTGKTAEELMVGVAVYYVVSNSTKKALQAIQANQVSEMAKEIKLASEVTGDLLDTFQEGVDGKKDVMKDINVHIHQLAHKNFEILGMVMKTQKNDQANQKDQEEKEEEEEEEKEKEDEEEEEEEEEEEHEEEEEEKGSVPAPAPISAPK